MAILQPEVPHYRTEFFQKLANNMKKLDIFIFNPLSSTKQSGFKVDFENLIYIANKKIKGILIYNPFPILWKYDTLVLMLHFAHLTTWLLLLTKFIHRRQIILWGQGISVKRYLQEEKQPDWKLKLQIRLADGVWIYTEKDANQWKKIFPNKPIVALNNTLTGVTEMVEYKPVNSKMN